MQSKLREARHFCCGRYSKLSMVVAVANGPPPLPLSQVYKGKWYTFAGLCCQSYCHGSYYYGQCDAHSKVRLCCCLRIKVSTLVPVLLSWTLTLPRLQHLQVQIYDPVADSWTLGTNIPWFVDGSMSSAIIGGKCSIGSCGGPRQFSLLTLLNWSIYRLYRALDTHIHWVGFLPQRLPRQNICLRWPSVQGCHGVENMRHLLARHGHVVEHAVHALRRASHSVWYRYGSLL